MKIDSYSICKTAKRFLWTAAIGWMAVEGYTTVNRVEDDMTRFQQAQAQQKQHEKLSEFHVAAEMLPKHHHHSHRSPLRLVAE
jgi:hypothetical protein